MNRPLNGCGTFNISVDIPIWDKVEGFFLKTPGVSFRAIAKNQILRDHSPQDLPLFPPGRGTMGLLSHFAEKSIHVRRQQDHRKNQLTIHLPYNNCSQYESQYL
jgi:hypothetical protein